MRRLEVCLHTAMLGGGNLCNLSVLSILLSATTCHPTHKLCKELNFRMKPIVRCSHFQQSYLSLRKSIFSTSLPPNNEKLRPKTTFGQFNALFITGITTLDNIELFPKQRPISKSTVWTMWGDLARTSERYQRLFFEVSLQLVAFTNTNKSSIRVILQPFWQLVFFLLNF